MGHFSDTVYWAREVRVISKSGSDSYLVGSYFASDLVKVRIDARCDHRNQLVVCDGVWIVCRHCYRTEKPCRDDEKQLHDTLLKDGEKNGRETRLLSRLCWGPGVQGDRVVTSIARAMLQELCEKPSATLLCIDSHIM